MINYKIANLIRLFGSSGETPPDPQETVLWTNTSPTEPFPKRSTISPRSVSLSDSISNYKYLKIIFRNNGESSQIEITQIYVIENGRIDLVDPCYPCVLTALEYNDYYVRYYVVGTSNINFYNCTSVSDESIIRNNYNVPLQIIGIK